MLSPRTTAVSPSLFRRTYVVPTGTESIMVHCLFVSSTRGKRCDSHPRINESFNAYPASINLNMAYFMCTNTRSSPWSWVVLCQTPLNFGSEAFDISIAHSHAGRNKFVTLGITTTKNSEKPEICQDTLRKNKQDFCF